MKMPAAGRKYFFFDIDGTLTNDATHRIVPSAAEALHLLEKEGHFVSIATGRAHYKTVSFSDPIGIKNLVCAGGGCLVRDGKVVDNQPLDPVKIHRLLEQAEAEGLGWLLMLDDSDKVYMKDYRFLEQAGLRTELTTYIYDPTLDFHKLKHIFKVYLVFDRTYEETHAWVNEVGHLRMGKNYCVFQYDRKKDGILRMMRYMNADIKDVIVFGDAVNDLVMFDPAWFSIAMGNGDPVLKAKADYITDRNVDDGIYNACLKFGWIRKES